MRNSSKLTFVESCVDLFLPATRYTPGGSSRQGLISRKQWPLQVGDGSAPLGRGVAWGLGLFLQEADDKKPGLPGAHM